MTDVLVVFFPSQFFPLKKENKVIHTKEIKPETIKEFNPINIDPIILTPIALMDLYLIGNLLGALGLRKAT